MESATSWRVSLNTSSASSSNSRSCSIAAINPLRLLACLNLQMYRGGKIRDWQQAQAQVSCPEPNCSSTTVLVAALAAQLVLLMAYLMYRDSKEAQAKKFY